jgi:peptidoglycan/LPS O-acetylase OafA/YrhL
LAIEDKVSGHRDDIQALRGFAVLAVVAYHAGLPVHGGFVGVDIFFVISGFVITKLILCRYSDGSFAFREFFEKRVLRLVPLLTLVNIVTVLFALVALSPFGEIQQVTAAMKYATVFGANYYFYTANDYLNLAFHPLRHLWSLSVEEQFYLFFPFLLMGLVVISRKLKRDLVTIGIMLTGVISFGYCLQASRNSENVNQIRLAFFGTQLRAWEFLIGALAFCLLDRFGPIRSRLYAEMVSIIGFVMMAYGVILISTTAGYPNAKTTIPVIGTALLIFGGSTQNRIGHRFANPLLVRIGDISYGWYLWHWPLIVFVQKTLSSSALVLVLTSGVSLLLAVLTFRYFENPIRYSSKLAGRKSWAVLAFCILVSLSVVATVNKLAATGLGVATDKPENALQSLGACYSPTAVLVLETQCDNGLPESGSSILLVGDSQAESAADGIFQAAKDMGVRAFGYGAGGCPMRSRSTVKESAWCPDVQNAYVSAIEKFAPKIVIFANRYDQYAIEGSEPGANDLRIPFSDGHLPVNRAEQNQTIIESLVEQIQRVRDLGPEVIVMLETPTVSMSSSSFLTKHVGELRSKESGSAKRFNIVRDELIAQIREEVSGMNGVIIVDPQEFLCENYPECSAEIDGTIAYWEKQHLNRFGSMKLVPLWMKTIEKLNEVSGG